ncbi:hypothetical protein D6833_07690, partial [Candidatus Parcubacteria bacterium]
AWQFRTSASSSWILPKGFKKIRHFGFLASRNKQLLALLHYMLGAVELETEDSPRGIIAIQRGEPETQAKIPCCPVCGSRWACWRCCRQVGLMRDIYGATI